MKSKVRMEIENGKVSKVQDKWNGKLPDNSLLNVPLPLSDLTIVLPSSERSNNAACRWTSKGTDLRKVHPVCYSCERSSIINEHPELKGI